MQQQGFHLAYDSPAFRIAVRAFDTLLSEMNDTLATATWLAGDALSLADLSLAPYIHRLDCLGLSELWSRRGHIGRWYAALRQRESWNAAIQQPHIRKWLDLMEMGGKEGLPKVKAILAE